MAIKKLFTENYIRGIADSIRTLLDDDRHQYNTREMAQIISSIHRGPKEVWIGSQISYDGMSEDELDPEICYIILEDGRIPRAYAGSVLIYDEPIRWDYEISGQYMGGGRVINTGFVMDDDTKSWEFILHINGITPDLLDYAGVYWDVPEYTGIFVRYLRDARYFAFRNTRGAQTFQVPVTERGAEVYYRVKYVVGSPAEIYWIDKDTLEETYIGSLEVWGRGGETVIRGWSGSDGYTIQSFKFRYLTEEGE